MTSASSGANQTRGNDAGRNNAISGDTVGTERLPVLQHGRSTFADQLSGNKHADSYSSGEPGTRIKQYIKSLLFRMLLLVLCSVLLCVSMCVFVSVSLVLCACLVCCRFLSLVLCLVSVLCCCLRYVLLSLFFCLSLLSPICLSICVLSVCCCVRALSPYCYVYSLCVMLLLYCVCLSFLSSTSPSLHVCLSLPAPVLCSTVYLAPFSYLLLSYAILRVLFSACSACCACRPPYVSLLVLVSARCSPPTLLAFCLCSSSP
eukprot:SAG31_NODE_4313_length_3366_cov_3.879706_4_plen_260_part_00